MEQKVNNNSRHSSGNQMPGNQIPGDPVSLAGTVGRRRPCDGGRMQGGKKSGGKARRVSAGKGDVAHDASARLLARLEPAGAFLTPVVDGRDVWSIGLTNARRLASGGGVSLGGGEASGETVRALLTAGALERQSGGARERLVLSDAGRARLRRAQAGLDGDPGLPAADPFVAQHADLASAQMRIDGVDRTVRINHAESPLAWLRRRRDRTGEAMIDEAAFAAGERLRADMTRAQMTPRVTASWETPASAGNGARVGQEPGEMALAARQRVTRALAAAGDEFAGVLVDVCGFLKGLEQVEKERGWPARSGKLILRMALARLAAHYGVGAARGPERGRSRGWRAP